MRPSSPRKPLPSRAPTSSSGLIRRCAGGDRLHVGHDGSLERRGAVPQQLLANTVNLVTCWRITASDRYLAVLPLFHVHGLANGLMTWLASGCRMRLVERFDAQRAAELVRGLSANALFRRADRLRAAARAAARAGARDRRRGCGCSSAAPRRFRAAVFDEFRTRFGHSILERYGMSETLMNLSNPYAGERRAGSVGMPLPGLSTRIVGPDGTEAAIGEVGELLVRGPERVQRLLAAAGGDRRGLHRRLVSHRRSRGTLRGRLLHAARAPDRLDHFRRLQHLPA